MTYNLMNLDQFREYMIEKLDEKIEELYYNYVEESTKIGDEINDVLIEGIMEQSRTND